MRLVVSAEPWGPLGESGLDLSSDPGKLAHNQPRVFLRSFQLFQQVLSMNIKESMDELWHFLLIINVEKVP